MQYPNLSRRGFISALSALASTVTAAAMLPPKILLLNETENEDPVEQCKDWITDKGDYYAVRIPDGKTFRDETFDKSVVFLMGNCAAIEYVTVKGFTNFIITAGRYTVTNSMFDSSGVKLANGKERSPVYFDNKVGRGQPYVNSSFFVNSKHTNQIIAPPVV